MPTSLLRKQAQRGEITFRLTEPMGRILRSSSSPVSPLPPDGTGPESEEWSHLLHLPRDTQHSAGAQFIPAE